MRNEFLHVKFWTPKRCLCQKHQSSGCFQSGPRSNKDCEVLKVTRSEGVVTRSPAFRKSTRTLRCREYFYGPLGNLMPHSQTLRFHELKIYKIGGGHKAPSSALPIGQSSFSCLPLLQVHGPDNCCHGESCTKNIELSTSKSRWVTTPKILLTALVSVQIVSKA